MEPRNLQELVGQESAVRLFEKALAAGRLAQSYLLVGPQGTGKETCAHLVVRHLFCEAGIACGECSSCRKLTREVHPDLLVLRPKKKEEILIEQIREAEAFLRFPPLEAPAKVVLLPEAERLNLAAANALLKSLEEPPSYAHFFLTALSPDNLLPTIVSRSQVVRFRPLPPDLIEKILVERFSKSPEEARALGLLAEGSLGRALFLAESGLLEDLHRFVTAMRTEDPGTKLKVARILAEREENLRELLSLVELWLWYSYLQQRGMIEFPRIFPSPAPGERALEMLSLVERVRWGLEGYANPELSLLVILTEPLENIPLQHRGDRG